jgi:hypothetical protein
MRNEIRGLPRLLDSLQAFMDRGGEVVLCDTGSTDGSAEYARSRGCRVEEVGDRFRIHLTDTQVEYINYKYVVDGDKPIVHSGASLFHFAKARNYVESLAKNDWVLSPDGDEVVTKLDIDIIDGVIATKYPTLISYEFVYSHDDFGNPFIAFNQSKFGDRSKVEWRGVVHECLFPKTGKGGKAPVTAPVSADVLKVEHYRNMTQNRSGYLIGLAYAALYESAAESPDRTSHYLAREMMYEGRYKSAIAEFQRHIEMNCWEAERGQSAVYIGECYASLQRPDNAVEWYHKAYDIHSNRREPFIRLAEHYYRLGDHQRTAAYAEAALAIKGDGFYSNQRQHYTDRPHELLYWAYWWMGDKARSKENFQKALAYNPKNPKYVAEAKLYA